RDSASRNGSARWRTIGRSRCDVSAARRKSPRPLCSCVPTRPATSPVRRSTSGAGCTAMSERSGGEIVAEVLQAAGVRVVFTILSIHNIPIIDALVRAGPIRIVAARSESGAANMADGYARATGLLGVVITSTGVGAANAAGPLLEAYDAASPVLHLTGQVDSSYLDTDRTLLHANPRQLAMLGTLGKAARRA